MTLRLICLMTLLPILLPAETLTLPQAMDLALKNHYSIRIARNQSESAEISRVLAKANMFPTLKASGGYTFIHDDLTKDPNTTGTNGVTTSNAVQGALTLNWTLFDGFRMFRAYEQVHATADLNQMSSRVKIESTALQVIEAYWNLVAQTIVLQHAQAQLAISQEQLQKQAMQQKLGNLSQLEILQSQVDLNTDSATYLDARLQLDLARSELNLALGRNAETPIEVIAQIPLPVNPPPVQELVTQVQKSNRSLAISRKAVQVKKLTVDINKASYWPVVSFTGSYGLSKTLSNPPSSADITINDHTGQAGIAATWNLFNGFQDRVAIQNAEIERQNAALELKQTEMELESQVRNAYTQTLQSIAKAQFEERSLQLAQKNFERSQFLHQSGQQSGLELRTAQQQLFGAQLRSLQAHLQAQLNTTQLNWLTGNLRID